MLSRFLVSRFVLFAVAALLALAAGGAIVSPRPLLPAAADITLQQLATGIGPITTIANAGDSRLFLTVQTGTIVIFSGGQVQPSAFLDLSSIVSCCGERGLLGLAFHPQFATNRFFFVNYTNAAGNTVIARYQASAGNPNAADPSSAVTLVTIVQPFANHNGGQLQFGPDGYLYIGMGDGGSANDPMCNAQRDDTLLGKLLRIDVNQNVSSPPFYGIPPSNPFAGPGGPLDEIWAKGLRNPWRFSFDRATGDLYIADVGQSAREEIDFQPRSSAGGENYGWKFNEGTLCGVGGSSGCPAGVPPCNSPSFKTPLYEYSHDGGTCSGTVIGGYVYRGSAYPAINGTYFYGDYCYGWLFGDGQMLTPNVPQLTTFGEDAAGEIYLGTETGRLLRIVGPVPTPVPTRVPPARSDRSTRTPRVRPPY
jgi:glucose/arabinose dehydrogenase